MLHVHWFPPRGTQQVLHTVAPKYNFCSPHQFFCSPHPFFCSPHQLFSSPHQLFSSPHPFFCSPHHLFSSPHHLFFSLHPDTRQKDIHNVTSWTSRPPSLGTSPWEHQIQYSAAHPAPDRGTLRQRDHSWRQPDVTTLRWSRPYQLPLLDTCR